MFGDDEEPYDLSGPAKDVVDGWFRWLDETRYWLTPGASLTGAAVALHDAGQTTMTVEQTNLLLLAAAVAYDLPID